MMGTCWKGGAGSVRPREAKTVGQFLFWGEGGHVCVVCVGGCATGCVHCVLAAAPGMCGPELHTTLCCGIVCLPHASLGRVHASPCCARPWVLINGVHMGICSYAHRRVGLNQLCAQHGACGARLPHPALACPWLLLRVLSCFCLLLIATTVTPHSCCCVCMAPEVGLMPWL